MKAGWRDAPLALLDLAVSNMQGCIRVSNSISPTINSLQLK